MAAAAPGNRRLAAFRVHIQGLREAVDAGRFTSIDDDSIASMIEYALEENLPEDQDALDAMMALVQDSSKSNTEKISGVDRMLRPIEMRLGLRAPEAAEPAAGAPGKGGRRHRKTKRRYRGKKRHTRRR